MDFYVLPEHIKLLQAAEVRWEDCEFGAPSIDCKRPYGNSDVLTDIAEILDWDLHTFDRDRARQLHKETEIVLQIVLQIGSMTTGRYAFVHGKWHLQAETA